MSDNITDDIDATAGQGAESAPPADTGGKAAARATRAKKPAARFEEFDALRPDGETVRVRRNVDTGESVIVGG